MKRHRLTESVSRAALVAVFAFAVSACEGYVHEDQTAPKPSASGEPQPDTPGVDEPPGDEVDEIAEVAATGPGLRRLTNFEYRNAITDLLGPQARPDDDLAAPTGSTFGNAAEMQSVTGSLIENAEAQAKAAADAALPDLEQAEQLMGCSPQDAEYEQCMNSFVRSFGRRALRRPLSDQEVSTLTAIAIDVADPANPLSGPRLVVQVLLQHAEFLYRKELGQPVDGKEGLFKLNDYEIATRMAFLLWGSIPDEKLLEAAEAGELSTSDGRRAQAERMVFGEDGERDKALRRIQQFHGRWLGYHNSQLPADIGEQARAETSALIERLIFEQQAQWSTLLIYDKTFVGPELAAHYGLEHPGGEEPAWVDYGDSKRAGILSHATFLNTGTTVGVTSPTIRGKHIYERLFCGHVPPPPGNLDIDEQKIGECGPNGYCLSPAAATDFACDSDADCPESLACKTEHSAFYMRPGSGCAGCHVSMDPIGLGLENLDHTGAWRDVEEPKPVPEGMAQPNCEVDGQGNAPGLGEFKGPGELGQLLASSEMVTQCMMRQYYQFAWGLQALPKRRHEGATALHDLFASTDQRMLKTLTEYVAAEPFILRRAPDMDQPDDTTAPDEDLLEGVDVGIAAASAPTIDGQCSEYSEVAALDFTHSVSGYNNSADCRLSWNGDTAAPRLHGCCVVEDAKLEALNTGASPEAIWDDDGVAFLVGSSAAEADASMLKAEINIHESYEDATWPGGQPHISHDANIEAKVVQRDNGYTLEWAADLSVDLQQDPTGSCNFRINDRDDGTPTWSHVFGEGLLKSETWGLCQFLSGP